MYMVPLIICPKEQQGKIEVEIENPIMCYWVLYIYIYIIRMYAYVYWLLETFFNIKILSPLFIIYFLSNYPSVLKNGVGWRNEMMLM